MRTELTHRILAPTNTTCRGLALCLLLWSGVTLVFNNAIAGSFAAEFESGPPAGATLFGSAYVDSSGGFGGGGALKLTDAFVYGENGYFVINDLDAGVPITGFTATFKLLVGGGNGADGFSFNFANDLPDSVTGTSEEGAGSGLTLEFDTYNNGGGEAPAIDIKLNGSEIATSKGNLDLFRTGDYIDVSINLGTDGTLNLTVNGTAVYSGLFIPWLPTAGRFGLAARTGGLADNHWVDNLSITTTTTLPQHPIVRAILPAGVNVRGDTKVSAVILDGTLTKVKPASLRLNLNGTVVIPSVFSAGGVVTATYQPSAMLPPGDNSLKVTYTDTAGQNYTFSGVLHIAPYIGPTGNVYELVRVPFHITWPDANTAAGQRTYAGHHGHLATITSFAEDLYLDGVRRLDQPIAGNSQVWVGGYQDPSDCPPGDNWHWVNNEGPISGVNGGSTYANWHPGEPNDFFGWATENYLAIGLHGDFGWNDDGYVGNGTDGGLDGYIMEYEAQNVAIDIKPGGTPNVINLGSNGKIPVAILSSATFDAATVDPTTVTFGHSGTEASVVDYSLSDVNGDGRQDLVCHFNTQDAGLICGDTSGLLRAKTKLGWPLLGSDSIVTLPCPPYTLSLQAMQDVNKITDVYLNVNVSANGCAPALISTHVLLQALDLLGHVRWSANAQNVPLVPNPNNSSTGDLKFNNLLHLQNFQAQAQVPSCQGNNILVLRQQGTVLYRPDLAVKSVDSPASVYSGLVFNVSALIAELKGDLGATGSVYLVEGSTVLDHADGVGLTAHGTAGVVFSAALTDLGTHHLKIVIGNEVPGDFDLSNNEMAFAVDVTQPPAFYSASYSHYQDEFSEEYNWPFYQAGTNYHNYNEEYFSEYLNVPVAINFPLNDVTVQFFADSALRDNFDLPNLAADYSNPAPYYYAQVYRHLADGVDLYIYTYNYPGFQASYGQLSKNAVNDVYYSAYHNVYWGDGQSSGVNQYGTFLNAVNSMGARFTLQSGLATFGGTITIPLNTYSWNNPFDYEDASSGAFDRGFDRGSSTSGYNSGYVTP